jgi:hypothetical protein
MKNVLKPFVVFICELDALDTNGEGVPKVKVYLKSILNLIKSKLQQRGHSDIE